ncbi:MAG: AAA family ATPase [Nitrospina sp.]|jgi:flagellar biosynthesis protein FlhF|nr:AAA family ATPase [Nitrospina sp.]MBT3876340.1 AAA family ATPase [Nitrospina sp.]MBT4049944.1 AAA family ATPase [Nitrospina sp.]MBT4556656.1 AAA family ATPase [Nitrospina sp.]MBT5348861.1 AAA family ATPase [Nitrospina sp.]
MRIRKFTASNYSIALQEVKQELGADALILSTRSIKPPSPIAGKKEATRVEITAAVEFAAPVVEPEIQVEDKPENKDADLKSLIFSLLSQTDRAQSMGLMPHQFDTFSRLVEGGLDEKLASKILKKALEQNSEQSADSHNESLKVMNLMKRVLPCKGEIDLNINGPKIVAFVGPTGVGKTTTVAKIAAEYALRRGKKVAIVSLDTYRLGAVDQLRIYGEIMEVPVEVAGGKEELRQIIANHKDKDLILIDTTGRSHQDKDYSRQLKEVFDAVGGVETHLVLSVTAQEKLFTATYHQFSSMGVDRVLFTKLDEGLNFGSLFNFSVRNRLPISYFTSGQQVPEDLEVARPERVISLIFN